MCTCFIVPPDILTKLSQDPRLPPEVRKAAADTARIAHEIRLLRIQALRTHECRLDHRRAGDRARLRPSGNGLRL